MRRPLVPLYHDDIVFGLSPCERLMDHFGWQSVALPPYEQHCLKPLVFYRDLDHIAQTLGFSASPTKKVDRYPLAALKSDNGRRQHPKAFLQWGWAMRPHKQAMLEMGDATFFVAIHFIKDHPGNNGTPWHLDRLEVCGHKLRCDLKVNEPLIRRVLLSVQGAVAHLNTDNWEKAESLFHRTLDSVVRELAEGGEAIGGQRYNYG